MKSKSFNTKQNTPVAKLNKTYDFTGYYKTAAETIKAVENSKTNESLNERSKQTPKNKKDLKRSSIDNNFEPIDISLINIEGPALNSGGDNSKVTSTPQSSRKSQQPKVKSIMKNSSGHSEDNMNESEYFTSSKPKKRNKSVSFMLEESEELVIKKTKSNDSIEKTPNTSSKTNISKAKFKKLKKNKKDLSEKENKGTSNVNIETGIEGKSKQLKQVNQPVSNSNEAKDIDNDIQNATDQAATISNNKIGNLNKKRKIKKGKKPNPDETSETNESNLNHEQIESKHKKIKKNKVKSVPNTDADSEPVSKLSKKDVKPEAIVENLENLSIGDTAHTLTNLLDEMTVAEKDKRKKNKRKIKKDKKQTVSTSSSENADLEKIDEGKEKVKWKKRKWNKDRKGDFDEDALPTSVIVDNLPLSIMCLYKKILSDHFGKHGIIKGIGIAEVYPTEVSKPVFTTTINFCSDGAATKALEEDNTIIEGNRIRVRQPLPPTQTTMVVRSYTELTEQALSTTFLPAGKIRSIRQLVKGRKAIATAFMEFDGPETLEKALKLGQGAKINGKKLHVSRFEIRKKKKKTSAESENEGDSENSNE